jgi:hypothetical protein
MILVRHGRTTSAGRRKIAGIVDGQSTAARERAKIIVHPDAAAALVVQNHALHRDELGGGGPGALIGAVVQNHALHRDELGGGVLGGIAAPCSAKSCAPPRRARGGKESALWRCRVSPGEPAAANRLVARVSLWLHAVCNLSVWLHGVSGKNTNRIRGSRGAPGWRDGPIWKPLAPPHGKTKQCLPVGSLCADGDATAVASQER